MLLRRRRRCIVNVFVLSLLIRLHERTVATRERVGSENRLGRNGEENSLLMETTSSEDVSMGKGLLDRLIIGINANEKKMKMNGNKNMIMIMRRRMRTRTETEHENKGNGKETDMETGKVQ